MRAKQRVRVHVVTMGCAKNTVDSEKLMAQLLGTGIEITASIDRADVAIINTCGFIQSAKQESLDVILEHVKRKSDGRLKKVLAMGCLTERYLGELQKEIPEVDRFFGAHQMADVVKELGGEYRTELLGKRHLTTPPHTAYLKISEGCDHPCSFCAIPIMRGAHVSRPSGEIVEEARQLVAGGVRELVVIGQDTTNYGLDLGGKRGLAALLTRLAELDGVEWVRLMYAYPSHFPEDVLDVIAEHPHVCSYLDLPIQHIADSVLKSMRRGITRGATEKLIERIRHRVPGIALRTTLIVGYPAETGEAFEELREFVRQARFDRLGVFSYSSEEGTTAEPLGDPVAETEKERRRGAIMEIQQEISRVRNEALIGSRLRVLIERKEQDQWVGRTEHDAPEIDNEVFVSGDGLAPGTFRDVEIVDAYEYDIVGRV